MEKDRSSSSVSTRVKRRLGLIAGSGRCEETGRTWAEERMISRVEKKGIKAFSMILPSAETGLKHYSRVNKKED